MAKHPRTITRRNAPGKRRDGRSGGSLTDQVVEDLRREILRAQLAPGELVNEPELAARYGVSKTPVREALRLLLQEGWVLIMPRKGYLIRPLALDDVREIFALRRLLEPALTADTARRRSDRDVEALRGIVAHHLSAESEFDVMIQAANDFHQSIADLSGNERAAKIISRLLDEVNRLMHLMPRLEDHLRSVAEVQAHQEILAAIEDQDGEAAAERMREHLVVAGRSMAQAFVDGT